VIGNFDYVFFINVSMEDCFPVANTIPAYLYASYMMMFALMVPVIVTGTKETTPVLVQFLIIFFL
jgi:ammonium transporter, Amt family